MMKMVVVTRFSPRSARVQVKLPAGPLEVTVRQCLPGEPWLVSTSIQPDGSNGWERMEDELMAAGLITTKHLGPATYGAVEFHAGPELIAAVA